MNLTIVTWQELMDEWHTNPQKLLAWLTKLFWDAEIDPESSAGWMASMGLISLGNTRSGHSVHMKLCNKCMKVLRWKSVTGVSEKDCQCICHDIEEANQK